MKSCHREVTYRVMDYHGTEMIVEEMAELHGMIRGTYHNIMGSQAVFEVCSQVLNGVSMGHPDVLSAIFLSKINMVA